MRRLIFLPFLLALSLLLAPPGARAATYEFLDDEAEPQVDVSFGLQTQVRGGLTVVFDWRDNLNFYSLELMPDSAALRSVVAGNPQRLATAKVAWSANPRVTIKRRQWTMQVLVDRQVILTAYDGRLTSGRIGSLASAGWKWTGARVQPVEEHVFYNDDFTRAEGQGNEWQNGGGKWTLTATSDNITAKNVEMSANPFSFLAETPSGAALAYVEPKKSRFWDNYDASVSVRPGGRGAVGLAVYMQDAKNYLAFTWNATEGPQARQLVRVEDGKATILDRAPGAFLPRQWYRIGVRTSPGFVEAFIDEVPVFKVRDDSFGQGGIGLMAQNMAAANFDDVRVRSYDYYRLDFTGVVSGAWDEVGGSWTPLQGNQNGILASAPTKADRGATRVYLTGRSDWQNYEFSVAARSGEAGAAGIVAGYRDAGNYTIFRWAGEKSVLPYRGRQQILTFREGKAQIVRDEPVALLAAAAPDGFVPVRMRVVPGAFAIYVGDRLIAQRADEGITPGRPGLYSQGMTTAQFRDAVMYFPPPPEPPKIAPKMAEDALMVGWASPAGEWPSSTGDSGVREYWNTGEFFGDASLEYRWRRASVAGQKLEFALRADKGKFLSGYLLSCEGLGKQEGARVSLIRGAETLKTVNLKPKFLADVDVTSEDVNALSGIPLKVNLEGHGIMLYVGEKPVMSYVADSDEKVPQGTHFAVRLPNSIVRTRELRALSTNRDDYTFTEAPTDWYSVQGQWAVISRWPCYSDWSFFGGKGLNPVLWSKRSYGLDTVVEIYANNQMDLPKEIGYSNPGNLNITILGDGKNPSSGYSFVVAGWDNTVSKILKGRQQVAINETENARFEKPINQNLSFHKRWFYIRAEARRAMKSGQPGVMLRLSVDDNQLMEYFDADPLPEAKTGGQVAFWTVDGAMMIARAKIESASMGNRAMPTGLLDAAAPGPAEVAPGPGALLPRPQTVDDLPVATIDAAEGIWTVRNATAGGTFAVDLVKPGTAALKPAPLTVTPETKLEWEWLPGEAKVDFYAMLGDELHFVPLTGGAGIDARARLLGDVKQIAAMQELAGGWQKVTINIGAALKKNYPGVSEWKLDALSLGALHGDEYHLLGFSGNALGTSYKIKNVRLVE